MSAAAATVLMKILVWIGAGTVTTGMMKFILWLDGQEG